VLQREVMTSNAKLEIIMLIWRAMRIKKSA